MLYYTDNFCSDIPIGPGEKKNAVGRSWWASESVYHRTLWTFKHIFKTEGMRGLYRGIIPEYYKVVPGVGIAFMTFEELKKLLSTVPN